MAFINTIAEAEEVLATFVPLARKVTGKDITVERMRPLMDALGNPQRRLKIVHIAGTSGKTSTAYFIAKMLQLSGKKVGLTVSPHVDSVAERIQINLKPLDEAAFCSELSAVLDIVKQGKLEPTYFELLVALAYWYFARTGVDYAVVETGLGGLQDGTNIADNHDKVCAITDIGLDHLHILGHTIPEIARQKTGIIHPHNTVFMHEQPDEVMQVIEDWCRQKSAILRVTQNNTYKGLTLENLPEFQQRNWRLAQAVFEYIRQRDGLGEIDIEASLHTRVPGRMDTVQLGGKTIVMDGAHNEQKMQAFINSFMRQYPGVKVPVLLSLKQGKELAAVLPLIRPVTARLFITTFEQGQDLPIPAIDAAELGKAAESFRFKDIVVEPDQERSYQLFLQEVSDMGVITGSFYLIGQLRQRHPELRHA